MKILNYPRQRKALAQAFGQADERDDRNLKLVQGIIDDVRDRGDAALAEYSHQFDGRRVVGKAMHVSPRTCRAAWDSLDKKLARALDFAADGIRAFHERQIRKGFVLKRGGARLEC
jgi:histidinol dehydrogenase